MTTTRRRFVLGALTAAGAGVVLPWSKAFERLAWATVSEVAGADIPKFQSPLVIPPVMPRAEIIRRPGRAPIDYYEIAVRQFRQQVLPAPFPATTVWGYGHPLHASTFHAPSFTIEARYGRPSRVRWSNQLMNRRTGAFLPHLLPVDPTLHWANPAGGREGRDAHGHFEETPGPYTGPVPMITHVHGAETTQESDGYAEAWYLPEATNIPRGYAMTGSYFDRFRRSSPLGPAWAPGAAVFEYPNRQRPTTLWYHDHTLGMTRLNVYAGPAGFYLLRGGPHEEFEAALPGPAPARGDAPGAPHYEIPLAIQDRSFDDDGSLFYPDTRAFFDGFEGPYVPHSDMSPIWNPEFFGTAMMVNGHTWPYLETEQRRYRLRLLNGCNSRFLMLKLDNDLPFWMIGAEGGFLPSPVEMTTLLLAPAERADVIVDFTNVPVGTEVILQNVAPDEPFGGGVPGVDFEPADPASTGQVMQFRVVSSTTGDPSAEPGTLSLPAMPAPREPIYTRKLSLNEEMSKVLPDAGPAEATLGTVGDDGVPVHADWDHPVTEIVARRATEMWELHNFTADAHPIHVHATQFRVVDRQPFDASARAPEPWESGFKDTVIAYPGEITRIALRFKRAGRFVWHCHIVEHEDNEMMRPFDVKVAG